jgi:protein-tyrosine phosphatase
MFKPCSKNHVGAEPIKVGPYEVYAGGLSYLRNPSQQFEQFDVLVPLEGRFIDYGYREVVWALIPDFHPPGPEIINILKDEVIPAIKADKKVLVFCTASHGRTGTVLAGLIALLEPETDDPIAAVRKRHCECSVETVEQAAWVRSLHQQVVAQKVDEVVAEADPC